MDDQEWPQPPIWFEDLPVLMELLEPWEARWLLRGWVLVPAHFLPRLTVCPRG